MAQQNNSFSSGNSLLFGLLNTNHSKTANILLDRDITFRGLDVVLLNEPYYSESRIIYFNKNYNIISFPDSQDQELLLLIPLLIFLLY